MGGGGQSDARAMHRDDTLFLVGSYTDVSVLAHTPKGGQGDGIYSVALCSKTGRLTPLHTTRVGPNPAFIVRHPTLPHRLYATTECIVDNGELLTLELDRERGLVEVVARQSAMGKSTCYVNIEQQSASYMVLVNYWDAKLSTVPLSPDGTAGTPTEVLMQPGAEYVAAQQPTREEHWTYRQRWPHSHCCVTEPYTQQLMFVTDLGLDKVFAYTLDAAAGCLSPQGEVQLKKGRGPRHLVFHPKHQVAYVGNELESTVTVLRYNAPVTAAAGSPYTVHDADDEGALLSHAQTLSTLPEEFRNEGFVTPLGVWKAASHSSEIRLHPNGRYLYVGNRGHDSICVLAIDEVDGSLSLVEIHPSGGRCPRNFNFDRTGRFLVVGNQDTNTLNTFSICAKSGRLSEVHTLELPSPNFVYAVPH